MYLHFAEHCCVEEIGPNRFRVEAGTSEVELEVDPQMSVALIRGQTEPILGWVSRGYHRKNPSTTLEARCGWTGNVTLITKMKIKCNAADPGI